MREKPIENVVASQIKLIRKYLKVKIQEDDVTFRGHTQSRNHVYDLIKRTVANGESHSALIIGPRGCGKTTMINSVIQQLSNEVDFDNDAIIVRLNGLIHHDEKVALKSITAQMQLENAVDGKVFGTFAEQLSFLLSCLCAADRSTRSMVFLLDECDLFCKPGRTQTLLYNLFDVTHSKQAPMCVLGITNRIDVMDLLEKRVKSRFSHRHIFIFPNEADEETSKTPLERCLGVLVTSLSVEKKEVKKRRRKKSVAAEEMDTDQDIPPIPEEVLAKCKIEPKEFAALDPNFIEDWNARINSLAKDEKVVDAVEKFCYYMANEQVFRNVLFQLVSKLKPSKPYIATTDIVAAIDAAVCSEHRVSQLQSLSTLELSLVVAMLHGTELLDNNPLNIEMVLHRYQKFASANSSTQSVPRPVIVKAFEHLQQLEIIVPARGQADHTQVQKEYRLHSLAASPADIRTAVRTAKHLPTEIVHWMDNNIG